MSLQDARFQDKTIVITGAGGNFGREGCLFFASRGARVAALDKSPQGLEETKKAVEALVPAATILTLECDVTNAESVQSAIDDSH